MIFDLRFFDLYPFFQEHNSDPKQGIGLIKF